MAGADNEDGYKIVLNIKGSKSKGDGFTSQTFRKVQNVLRKNMATINRGRSSRAPTRGAGQGRTGHMPSMQRCAVRMTYAPNKMKGQWAAHGKYISRESANHEHEKEIGFGSAGEPNIPETLSQWQEAGDERMFKFILSPEFGQDMESMEKFTRAFVTKLERDLGTSLEWAAIDHYNTDHPHVHLAVRGVDQDGQALLIRPDYVKTTLRSRAQEAATEQLGVRTDKQQERAYDREVSQQRYTTLDRSIMKRATQTPDGAIVSYNDGIPKSEDARRFRIFQIRRMAALERMGLATRTGNMQWALHTDYEKTLRQLQMGNDVLKNIHAARDIQSDPRMPVQRTELADGESIAGRLIGTGLDEGANKPYLVVESIDGKVHYLYQTRQIEQARAENLKRGDYITLDAKANEQAGKRFVNVRLKNYGNAERLLKDDKQLAAEVLKAIKGKKTLPTGAHLAGWLGRYQQALHTASVELTRRGVISKTPTGHKINSTAKTTKPQDVKKGVSRS